MTASVNNSAVVAMMALIARQMTQKAGLYYLAYPVTDEARFLVGVAGDYVFLDAGMVVFGLLLLLEFNLGRIIGDADYYGNLSAGIKGTRGSSGIIGSDIFFRMNLISLTSWISCSSCVRIYDLDLSEECCSITGVGLLILVGEGIIEFAYFTIYYILQFIYCFLSSFSSKFRLLSGCGIPLIRIFSNSLPDDSTCISSCVSRANVLYGDQEVEEGYFYFFPVQAIIVALLKKCAK
ncbi:MAG: hypothetical protein EZS28_041198 [Streblomastix strix]|uniref:Uncharacterized protein n=1 Tax=Streblomastix strix TaxID=222440 RepID=A0A5J4U0Q5_9EUKA|nr:MAG: hypothetical protein EZS28_041198 [Streblomastix strix]